MSTRSQKKSIKPVPSSPSRKRVENSWILMAKDELLNNNNFSIITLPHPVNGKPAKFCLDDIHCKIYEVVTFSEPHRSWFIGETVKSDGSIQMTTPINPMFLVLPRLRDQCSSRAVPLEDLLSEKGFDKILHYIKDLDNIADLKGPADLKAYKYNEVKALSWLEERVRRVSKVLRSKNVHVTSGSVSATFVVSSLNNDNLDEEFYLKYSLGIVSQYLEKDLISKLEEKFNFQPDLIESLGNKRKSEAAESKDNKKMKFDNVMTNESKENVSDFKPDVKKQKSLSAKEKSRQKAASGTKTISSFFAKK